MKIEYIPLDLDAIKAYKKNSPDKFFHKFGDLDLDNLPPNFDMAKHRRMIKNALPKTPLLEDEFKNEEEDENYTFPTTKKTADGLVKDILENKEVVVDAELQPENENQRVYHSTTHAMCVNGGETLQGNEII